MDELVFPWGGAGEGGRELLPDRTLCMSVSYLNFQSCKNSSETMNEYNQVAWKGVLYGDSA